MCMYVSYWSIHLKSIFITQATDHFLIISSFISPQACFPFWVLVWPQCNKTHFWWSQMNLQQFLVWCSWLCFRCVTATQFKTSDTWLHLPTSVIRNHKIKCILDILLNIKHLFQLGETGWGPGKEAVVKIFFFLFLSTFSNCFIQQHECLQL